MNLLKAVVFIGLALALFYRLKDSNLTQSINDLKIDYLILFLAIILMPVNWWLELIKWKLVVKPVAKVPNIVLYKSMLAGISTSIVTPNRIGNFLGRMVYFRPKNRAILTIGTLYANYAQFLASLLPGTIVVFFFDINALSNYFSTFQNSFTVSILSLILFFLCVFYFTLPKYSFHFLKTVKRFNNLFKLFQFHYSKLSFTLLLLSQVRFLVFCLQFYLFLLAFGSPSDLFIFVNVVVLYFITTLTPSLTLGKLFIRENYALLLLIPVLNNELIILSASFSIWLINLAIPSIVGVYYFLKIKHDVD